MKKPLIKLIYFLNKRFDLGLFEGMKVSHTYTVSPNKILFSHLPKSHLIDNAKWLVADEIKRQLVQGRHIVFTVNGYEVKGEVTINALII
jgi:hypothetical protein